MDTPKRSSTSISAPTDENDYESRPELSVSRNSAMPPQNKHYMSPTFSTASKAYPPRRKVLADRNELFDPQRSNLDSPKPEGERIGYGEEGFSESPYDPVTNYLTPRPRFLRYKPNRRLEILSRADNCVGEDADSGSGSGSGDESSVSQEDDVSQEIEEEFEEVEKKGCGLKDLMKFLLCLIVLLLSTSYISSMNSPTPSSVVQAVRGCKNGYHMIQDQFYGFLKNSDGGKYSLAQKEVMELVPSNDFGIQQELVTGIAVKCRDEAIEFIESIGLISEDDNYSEINIAELDNRVLYKDLELLEATEEMEALINFPSRENSAPDGTSKAENEVSELSEKEKVDKALITIPCSENTTSSVPDGTSETENEVVNELFEEEKKVVAMLTDDSLTNEEETSSKVQIIDATTNMSFLMSAIVGFLLSVMAAIYFQKRRNGRHSISQAVEPTVKQVQENNGSLLLANEGDANLENSESSDSSKSFLDSLKRDSNEEYQSRAPSIQLLGEFSVQEMSTSHRSYGRDRIIESEVSSHSVSVGKIENTIVYSSPLQLHSIFSEISSMETPNQKNIKTSEHASAEGESRKPETTTTPLRRSSRIRDRSIKSP